MAWLCALALTEGCGVDGVELDGVELGGVEVGGVELGGVLRLAHTELTAAFFSAVL